MTFEEWWDENKPKDQQFWFLEEVFRQCWKEAFEEGHEEGFQDGHSEGYGDGYDQGSSETEGMD